MADKMRVYELAKKHNMPAKEMVEFLNDEFGLAIKSHMSNVSGDDLILINEYFEEDKKEKTDKKNNTEKNNQKKVEENSLDKKPNMSKNSQIRNNDIDDLYDDENVAKKEKFSKSNKNKSQKKSDQAKSYNNEDFVANKSKKNRKKKNKKSKGPKANNQATNTKEEANSKIEIPEVINVGAFAEKIGENPNVVIGKLIQLGVMAGLNDPIEFDQAELIAIDFGKEITLEQEYSAIEEQSIDLDYEDNDEDLITRAPVVSVMGHVDHGKTSILDSIRDTHVTRGEAGGITQHIGAYSVDLDGRMITFLDTPGHEAFTEMRMRGAQSTDIAILVVAADDGVMPQTIEAISHARSAEVPIIVAINKIDKEAANVDRVKQELSEQGLMPEDWGGDTIMVPVSAHTKQGIDDLLEMILLVAEMRELRANPQRHAIGTVIEAKLDKGKGPMATVLVQNGTLRSSDFVVSGVASGRIRAMTDDKGKNIKKAGPSMPAVILGLSEVPNAGDSIYAVEDEKTAKTIADKNREIVRENRLNATNKVSLSNLFEKMKEGEKKQLDLIIKGDVKGSVEALTQSLLKIENEEVNISIIHSAVGGISESDVSLASASNAIVIGFNVRPNINAIDLAKELEVDIRTYRVIYDAIDDIEKAAIGMLDPEFEEEVQGRCEVRQTFKLPNNSIVAGVFVVSGKIPRRSQVRILRNDTVIHEGEIASLKRFKDDVRELNNGYEGGITIENFNDIKEGDFIESFIMKEIKRVWEKKECKELERS